MHKNVKIFLFKLLVLACVFIIADWVMGLGLKSIFYKQRSGKYFTTTHALKDCKEEIIIFGNSHAAQHFDAPLMGKNLSRSVFNFGNQGQNLFYVYPLVKTILSYHKPQLIIINLDYNELQYDLAGYDKLSIFLPYYDINPVIDSAISMMPDHEILKARSSLYRYNSTIGYVLLNTFGHAYGKSMSSLGYDPMVGNMCSGKKDNSEEVNLNDNKIVFDKTKINCLIRLINYIQAKKVKLLITTTPLFQYNNSANDLYKLKLQQILVKLNVDYLDYGNNEEFKGKCDLFHDPSHLNPAGADKWTNLCSDYIKSKLQ